MQDRLSPRDVVFLTEEATTTPRHNATLEIFEPGPDGFSYDDAVALITDRIGFVPRYRQRVQIVPGRIANPVWVDDGRFDIEFHVRRSAVPRPGTMDQVRELAARIVSRPLDRDKPLWEVYLVEGIEGGRVALLTKAHNALVDGIHTVDLGQLLLDENPKARSLGDDDPWGPGRTPSAVKLFGQAVKETVTDPETLTGTLRTARRAALRQSGKAVAAVGDAVAAIAGGRQAAPGPLGGTLSQQRRLVTLETSLSDYRAIRSANGGTVNDVILAVIASGLRGWLMTRAESLVGLRSIRAVVPISVIDEDSLRTSLGSQIAAHFVDLPVGEASPVVRLHQVSYSFESHRESGRSVAASRLANIAGFAPATFHAVGARVASAEVRTGYGVSIVNVPGPQGPLYAMGARMVATYPIHPLVPGHALSVGATSYDGKVFLGITADRDLIWDADVLGQCIEESLDELLDTATGARQVAPRGRKQAARTTPPGV